MSSLDRLIAEPQSDRHPRGRYPVDIHTEQDGKHRNFTAKGNIGRKNVLD